MMTDFLTKKIQNDVMRPDKHGKKRPLLTLSGAILVWNAADHPLEDRIARLDEGGYDVLHADDPSQTLLHFRLSGMDWNVSESRYQP